ncbi:hypothetical protein AHAS_Ahas09G0145000 [Arachis hypogaea]
MEMGVIFYELQQPCVYGDLVLHSFYVVAAEPRVCKYVVRDHPFQHPPASPLFDPDAPYDFPLSGLHPNSVHHPFDDIHTGDSSDGSPKSTLDVIVISDDEDVEEEHSDEEIEIVDLTSEDDDNRDMDIEIMDLTSDNDLVATSASSFVRSLV